MKLRTVALWAGLGMFATSAGALAIPLRDSKTAAPDPGDLHPEPPKHGDQAHFSAGDTLTVDARLGHESLSAGSADETFLLATVAGADAATVAAPPLHLGIVVDRSGSMKGARIANAIAAAVGTVERMRDGDMVTVVSFDTQAQIVVPPTVATASTRAGIENAIRTIRLGGDTCISCGLEAAMGQLMQTSTFGTAGRDHVTRMMLLSDGATNHGITDVPGLRALAGRMRDRGCSISTVGVDVDFDEKVMGAIAAESNGRHYFVANPSDLPSVFSQEFDSLLASVAKDSELTVDLAPGVEVEQVFDRSFRRDGSKVVVPFGTFSAKQEKTVLMKLRVPTGKDGALPIANVKLAYADLVKRTPGHCEGDLSLLVTNDASAQTEIDPFVAARVERSRTAQTLTDANKLFEQGRIVEAQDKLAKQEAELRATGSAARASAKAARRPSGLASSANSLDRDFERQIAAVAAAESNFGGAAASAAPATTTRGPADISVGTGSNAAPGRGAAGGAVAAAPPAQAAPRPVAPTSREGKAQVRSNQETANSFGL